MIGRLQEPDPGAAALGFARDGRLHQAAADRPVLHGRIDSDRADAGDRAALVDKVAADDPPIILGYERADLPMRQQRFHQPDCDVGRREIPRKIVLAGDRFERLEGDGAARDGIGRRAGPQGYADRLPLALFAGP